MNVDALLQPINDNKKSELFSDNPYSTADKWLLKENLPLSYRQQVVEFILQNSGQKNFALDTSYRDPYTGGEYYIILSAASWPLEFIGWSNCPLWLHLHVLMLSLIFVLC